MCAMNRTAYKLYQNILGYFIASEMFWEVSLHAREWLCSIFILTSEDLADPNISH